jgi:GNAT superfamily N-acetyltransferase
MLHISPHPSTSPEAMELLSALAADFGDRYGDWHENESPTSATLRSRLFLLAWFGDQAVGCVHLSTHEDDCAQISEFYVAPQFRGRGIGRELLRTLEAHARDMGVATLVCETGARQPEAAALFEHCGYGRVDRPRSIATDPACTRFSKTLDLAGKD